MNPKDWVWIVGNDESRAYSSAIADYVTDYPKDKVTRIANEVELYDALSRQNLKSKAPKGPFSIAAVRDALLGIDPEMTGNANTAAELQSVADEMGFVLPPIA